MSQPIRQFMPEIERNIILSKRLTLELYKVAGRTEAEVKEFAETHLKENFGMLFMNFVNFPMATPYPFLWKLQTSHSVAEEQSYIDKNALAVYISGLLQTYLSERMIDDVTILLFDTIESPFVGQASMAVNKLVNEEGDVSIRVSGELSPGGLESPPAVKPAPVRDSSFSLPNGQVVIVSCPADPITSDECDGYVTVNYKIGANIPPMPTPLNFMFNELGDAPPTTPDELRAGFEAFVLKNFMPDSTIGSIFLKDLVDRDVYQCFSEAPEKPAVTVSAPEEFITRTTTLAKSDISFYIKAFLEHQKSIEFETFCAETSVPFWQPVSVTHKGTQAIACVGHGGQIVVYPNGNGVAVDASFTMDETMINDFVERIRQASH